MNYNSTLKTEAPLNDETTQQPIKNPNLNQQNTQSHFNPNQPHHNPNPNYQQFYQQPFPPQPPFPPQQPFAPYPPQPPKPTILAKGLGIASMILGIISCMFFCYFFLAIPFAITGLVLGCISKSKAKQFGDTNGFAIAGIATSIAALGLSLIFLIYYLAIIGSSYSAYDDFFNGNYYYAIKSFLKL